MTVFIEFTFIDRITVFSTQKQLIPCTVLGIKYFTQMKNVKTHTNNINTQYTNYYYAVLNNTRNDIQLSCKP